MSDERCDKCGAQPVSGVVLSRDSIIRIIEAVKVYLEVEDGKD